MPQASLWLVDGYPHPVSPHVVCICLFKFPLFVRWGPTLMTLMTSCYHFDLCKDPVHKYAHSEVLGVRTSTRLFVCGTQFNPLHMYNSLIQYVRFIGFQYSYIVVRPSLQSILEQYLHTQRKAHVRQQSPTTNVPVCHTPAVGNCESTFCLYIYPFYTFHINSYVACCDWSH